MQKTTLYMCFAIGLTGTIPAFSANQGEIGNLLEQRLGGEIAGQAQQEQLALAKRARLAAITEGEQVSQSIQELKTTIQTWEAKIQNLLTDAACSS